MTDPDPMAEATVPASPPVAEPPKAATDPADTPLPAGSTSCIAAALAKAQLKIRNPAKGRTADIKSEKGRYQYKYSTLADGLDAIRVPLAEQEIAAVQTTGILGELLILRTRLIHSSGQFLETEWPIGAYAKLTPQAMGSALTYGRRYSLYCLVGIAGYDEDDDGEAAESGQTTIDADQAAYVDQLLAETKSDREKFLDAMGADSVETMSVEQFKRGVGLLERKKRHGP